jgi:hypothetical protein
MSRLTVTWLAGGLLAAAALSGCVSMPHSGEVQAVPGPSNTDSDDRFQFNPKSPQVGETPTETVHGWFEAMTATPVSTVVARQFLSSSEATRWSPEDGIMTYDTARTPQGFGSVNVTLFGVNELDARGRWLGPTDPDEVTLTFRMAPENGQWRIARVPDALIVDEAWFETSYQSANLYFFDPSAKVLVPEPVFLPRGDQLPTSLVRGLLQGPINPHLERSFLPDNASLDLAVTVTPDGVAQVPFRGDVASLPAETIDLMADQLAWTLRQDPQIHSIQLLADGEPLVLAGGATEFSVDAGSAYDPAGRFADEELFGLRQGRVVRVVDGVEQPITGRFGAKQYGLSDVSLNLDASLVAGVARSGTSVILSSVFGSASGLYSEPRTVMSGAVDLLHPAWDTAGRLWMVDRRRGGAVVSVFDNGVLRAVDVPGVTGERVTDFLVSRDGTRLVAAIDDSPSDEVVVSRIIADGRLRGTLAQPIVGGAEGALRIRDIGWHTPTGIFFVNAINGRQSELRSASIDGSPATFDPQAVYRLQDDVDTQVISSPRTEDPIYLQSSTGGFTPLLANSPQLPTGLRVLHYVG